MAIDLTRLPEDVERGAKGGPGFQTSVVTLASGGEQRNTNWSVARGSWDVGYGIRKIEDLKAVMAFFYARRGMARGFLFKDWADFAVTAEPVGTTDTVTIRQLQKTYDDTIVPYVRKITHPISTTLKVYVNDILAATPADYTLTTGGVLVFGSDPGMNVKATFEFDNPARFDTDLLGITLETFMAGEITNIPIVELRE